MNSSHHKDRPERFGKIIYSRKIEAVLSQKNIYLDEIIGILMKYDLVENELEVRLPLDEAICNSIQHGCNEDPKKHVKIDCFLDDEKWGIIFEDEGEGFTKIVIPDFNDPENLFAEGGRGVFLMDYYMDSVFYCGKGNILEMVKKIKKKS